MCSNCLSPRKAYEELGYSLEVSAEGWAVHYGGRKLAKGGDKPKCNHHRHQIKTFQDNMGAAMLFTKQHAEAMRQQLSMDSFMFGTAAYPLAT